MNPADSLPVIAEISLGIAGFTAIVSVLRQPGGGIARQDVVRSVYLLAYASATLLLALLPSLLAAIGFESATAWRLSSGAMALTALPGLGFIPRGTMLSEAPRHAALIWALVVCGALNLALQLANAAGMLGPTHLWPFLLGLLWYLVFCLSQFASLLFVRPSDA